MTRLQFRILYREFLFRMVDLELLSTHAMGDANKLLGRFAALLIFISLGLAVPALGVGGAKTPPALRLFVAWSAEHVLIATTMLVVGLFAVLSWDSTFPDRRDVLVLAPLPVRARTIFLAKVAAVATALTLTVVTLHLLGGIIWPFALGSQGTIEITVPALEYLPAMPPLDAAGIKQALHRDLAPNLSPEMGIVVGVIRNGQRRVYAYGKARPDSSYQIGSISKTFTGLLLAQMVEQGKVSLDEPVRDLIPSGIVQKPAGKEVTLLDLATHRSGFPPMPDNVDVNHKPNPGAGYNAEHLYHFVTRQGVARPPNPPFIYSNAGFSLLGEALANRAGTTYPELLKREITGPLGMPDTVVALSAEQRQRLIPAYSVRHEPRDAWQLDALAPAGGINSTAADLLNFLDAQLKAATPAIRLSHQLRNDMAPGTRIALAWAHNDKDGIYWHNGALSAYTSHAFFNPKEQYAAVVLSNQAISLLTFSDLAATYVKQRLTGERATSLASVTVPETGGGLTVIRTFAAYWITMLAAGAFIFCCVLCLQGLAAQLLPRRVFLRASSYLQLAAFCMIVSVYALQGFLADGSTLLAVSGDGLLSWSPTYWFLGLFQYLTGSPALAPLARRAALGLIAALSSTAVVYALSYLRTLRKIVEEPDIVPGAGGRNWLPPFGSTVHTAIVQFSIRTLARSRLHRVILAFYLAMGFAFMILLVRTPSAQQALTDTPVSDTWGQLKTPLLAATVAMMGFAIIGTRVVFSIPLDLRGNWIFRVTGARRVPECLTGSRRSLIMLAAAPVWLVSAAFCLWLWPWQMATGHLLILALIGLILMELCLHGFHKLPFTCSYLPGKSQVHLAVLGTLALLWIITLSVRYERQALDHPSLLAQVVIGLTVLWAALRWRTSAHARSESTEVEFEDLESPAIQVLGLSRDGSWPTT